MVTRVVNGDNAGDLGRATDFFGIEDDFIAVESTGSAIATFDGNDRVDASRSASHQIAYLGFGNDSYRGGITGADVVYDGDGADFVDLAGGQDRVSVGAGNDVFRGGDGIDSISFIIESNDGYGSKLSTGPGISVDLAKTGAQNFGRFGVDTISGFENIEGSGGNDKFFGTNANNHMTGEAGSDLIDGRGGNDTVLLGAGGDTVIGGLGGDIVFLGSNDIARDTVRYLKTTESGPTAASRDTVNGFFHHASSAGDRIDLKVIDANPLLAGNQAFVFRGSLAFRSSVVGEVRVIGSGADVIVQVDTDKDNASEMTILVTNIAALAKYDFVL